MGQSRTLPGMPPRATAREHVLRALDWLERHCPQRTTTADVQGLLIRLKKSAPSTVASAIVELRRRGIVACKGWGVSAFGKRARLWRVVRRAEQPAQGQGSQHATF